MLNAQKMVYMLVPLDASRVNRNKYLQSLPGEENSSNSYVTSKYVAYWLSESRDSVRFDVSVSYNFYDLIIAVMFFFVIFD